ncbi:hypothetical protein [Phenylobacterium immobile]|nr:hypothetical protein [Phenylobacterium immobile]
MNKVFIAAALALAVSLGFILPTPNGATQDTPSHSRFALLELRR